MSHTLPIKVCQHFCQNFRQTLDFACAEPARYILHNENGPYDAVKTQGSNNLIVGDTFIVNVTVFDRFDNLFTRDTAVSMQLNGSATPLDGTRQINLSGGQGDETATNSVAEVVGVTILLQIKVRFNPRKANQ